MTASLAHTANHSLLCLGRRARPKAVRGPSGNYLSGVEVLRITPDPASQEPVSGGVRYLFRIQDEPQTVIFRFKPERGGNLSGSLRVNDGPPTAFRQWLFP